MKTRLKMNTPMILLFAALSLFLLFGVSCARMCGGNDEPLSIQRTDFIATNLRVDGYFYHQYGSVGNEHISVLFLYRNGVMLYGGAFPKSELALKEQNFLSAEWITAVREFKSAWGVFFVDGDIIKLEERVNAWCRPYQSFIREGIILNDTTFRITKSYRSFGTPDVKSMDRTYHFRAFSPKPDSTNPFIP